MAKTPEWAIDRLMKEVEERKIREGKPELPTSATSGRVVIHPRLQLKPLNLLTEIDYILLGHSRCDQMER